MHRLLFLLPPERAHEASIRWLQFRYHWLTVEVHRFFWNLGRWISIGLLITYQVVWRCLPHV
jgi:hypothetical protein